MPFTLLDAIFIFQRILAEMNRVLQVNEVQLDKSWDARLWEKYK